MMIGSETARWLLTAVFAAAALAAVLPLRAPARTAAGADRAGAVFCLAMCAAMAAMTWLPEPAAAVWMQAAGFGCAGLWFGLGRSGWFRRPSLTGLHHALMAAAMIWMLAALPGVARMAGTGRTAGTAGMAGMAGMQPPRGQGPMAAMAAMGPPVPVLAVSALAAACCVIAAVPWLARAVGPGLRVTDPAAAGNALMSAGMAAMLLAML